MFKGYCMAKKMKIVIGTVALVIIGIACLVVEIGTSHAESELPTSGDGWSYSVNGDLTIESDRGWAGFLKNGFRESVRTLYLGKDVTNCRMYDLPNDVPIPDYYTKEDVLGYDWDGTPYYELWLFDGFFPKEIIVDESNTTFRVINDLLINIVNNEVALSESGLDDIVIPDGIQSIAYGAFINHSIKSVKFPSSLKTIGSGAFENCENLTSIVLPEGVTQLMSDAFSMCTALSNVELPETLEKIGEYAFYECAIESIQVPNSVVEIDRSAFHGCQQLKEVYLPARLKKIGSSTFGGCTQLVQIDWPDALETIGDQAFADCYSLRRVILPDTLQQIGDRSFWGCDLSLLRIPPKLAFLWESGDSRGYILNPHSKQDKTFEFGSVETVILSGSDYDFGYPAISNAKNVYFLGTPPADVGQILDEESVEHIYCSDAYEFEWTRSKVASWVRQKLTILPAAEIAALTEKEINATPEPTNTPAPTLKPQPSKTPVPVLTPFPTKTPTATMAPATEDKAVFDPIMLVFASVLALVVAGIVVVARKGKRQKKRAKK